MCYNTQTTADWWTEPSPVTADDLIVLGNDMANRMICGGFWMRRGRWIEKKINHICLSTDMKFWSLAWGAAEWTRCEGLLKSSSLSQNISDLYIAQHRAEVASALCFRFAGSKDASQFPTNQKNPLLLLLLQMTVEKQGYLMTMTLPEILVFNQPSVGISGSFLPKRIPRAARFHSCLLQSQAVRGLSQPRGLLWDIEHVEKTPLGFLAALLSGKNILSFNAWL